MAQAFTPGLVCKRAANVERLRELPVLGETVVRIGDTVRADQVVARAFLPGELHILRIAEKLGIESFEVMKGLKIKVGDTIREGDLICEHAGLFGLFKSRFQSPVDGVVELITERTGHVAVRGAAQPIEIDAYIDGRVTAVEEKKSVRIAARGAFVQGIFGVGGERKGIIQALAGAGEQLEVADLPSQAENLVLVSRGRPTLEVLKEAANRGAVGLVCGSIDDKVLAGYLGFDLGIALTGDELVSMTVIITEGFGNLLMSERTFALFQELQGKQASINGATQVRAGALRPEIVVPDPAAEARAGDETAAARGLSVGSSIRIIRVPYFGEYATVTELPHEMVEIETGAHARVLRARLEDGQTITVPRANVELV